jgi:hypothetical protein
MASGQGLWTGAESVNSRVGPETCHSYDRPIGTNQPHHDRQEAGFSPHRCSVDVAGSLLVYGQSVAECCTPDVPVLRYAPECQAFRCWLVSCWYCLSSGIRCNIDLVR